MHYMVKNADLMRVGLKTARNKADEREVKFALWQMPETFQVSFDVEIDDVWDYSACTWIVWGAQNGESLVLPYPDLVTRTAGGGLRFTFTQPSGHPCLLALEPLPEPDVVIGAEWMDES